LFETASFFVDCSMDYTQSEHKMTPVEMFLNDPDACYEKAETDLLRDALRRTHNERFLVTTQLYKMALMLKNAKVTHKPFISK